MFKGKGIELHLDNSNYLVWFNSIHLFYFGMNHTARSLEYGAHSGIQETRVVRLDPNGVYCTVADGFCWYFVRHQQPIAIHICICWCFLKANYFACFLQVALCLKFAVFIAHQSLQLLTISHYILGLGERNSWQLLIGAELLLMTQSVILPHKI